MSLIRLAYASEATFSPASDSSGVEPHVARILLASRRNNSKQAVVGGLYYGNHRFFQYLEGGRDEVTALYNRIRRDMRHRHVKKLLEEPLEAVTFGNWSMKYVPLADDVQRMLESHGMDRFEPDRFDRTLCEQMINIIRHSQGNGGLINHRASVPETDAGGVLTPPMRGALVAVGVVVVAALVAGGLVVL